MKLQNIAVVMALGCSSSLVYAFPTKILVKNETDKPQWVRGEVVYTRKGSGFAGNTSQGYGAEVESKTEFEVTKMLLPTVEQGGQLIINSLSIKINNKEIDLGKSSAIRIFIRQKDKVIVTTVEPLIPAKPTVQALATEKAMTSWWSRFKQSFADTVRFLFRSKKRQMPPVSTVRRVKKVQQ